MIRTDYTGAAVGFCMQGAKAAEIFRQELAERTGFSHKCAPDDGRQDFRLRYDENLQKDEYRIACGENGAVFYASGIRGFLYAVGLFLRRSEYSGGKIRLVEDISGDYSPFMKIRGHQLGYRTTPNAYDAWDVEDYVRYYKDLMFFGVNTVEHIPSEGKDKKNRLMKYMPEEMCALASEAADQLDLDVSLWYPNSEDTLEEALERRRQVFSQTGRIDAVFPPGGDPGDFDADEFIRRVRAISRELKKSHPAAEMWPSAQAPHHYENWGDRFIAEMDKHPEEIDGVILGPNRAMDLDELRMRLPGEYPIRLYPDITHNVRCEYPVHFNRDDWHFAWATAESRECVNPRPREYRLIHELTKGYIIGSVSYSEGVNDDLNKMIWSDMDYFGDADLRTSVEDYVRLFFPGGNVQLLTDGIFGLEENWYGDPAESAGAADVYEKWIQAGRETPELYQSWRYLLHLFRASCDLLVQKRRRFELSLIRRSAICLKKGNYRDAEQVLREEFPAEYQQLRQQIETLAASLFEKIGYQTDVNRYCADSWERGAVLDTIDLPITDRAYYCNRFQFAETLPKPERLSFMQSVYTRTNTGRDEYYYSVALHGLEGTGCQQKGEVYMNFRGDNPSVNNGSFPMSVLRVYDNYTFSCKISGLTADSGYRMRIVWLSRKNPDSRSLRIAINGKTVYAGAQFGTPDEEYDRRYLAPGLESAVYDIPEGALINGCGLLELSEDSMGVMFSEIIIEKRKAEMQ